MDIPLWYIVHSMLTLRFFFAIYEMASSKFDQPLNLSTKYIYDVLSENKFAPQPYSLNYVLIS